MLVVGHFGWTWKVENPSLVELWGVCKLLSNLIVC